MRVTKGQQSAVFTGEDGETLRVSYTNWGEPFRQGARFEFMGDPANYSEIVVVDLEASELQQLHDTIGKLLEKV